MSGSEREMKINDKTYKVLRYSGRLNRSCGELEWAIVTEPDPKSSTAPPLGVRPYWTVIPERIDNLAEAIKKYSGTKDTEKVALWAKEIAYLAKLKALLDVAGGKEKIGD